MTMQREWLVDFGELSQIAIPCLKCKTKVLLDCRDMEARIPEACPSCNEEYGDPFRSTLRAYREVYRKLSDPQGRRVQVRIVSDPEA